VDETVLRAQAKWPDVPDVYGWLALDRRGQWLLRNPAGTSYEPIGNAALREFISRNYSRDARGCWFFQNGPQRVFVRLAYTPLVVRTQENAFVDQRGRAFENRSELLDEQGSLLLPGEDGIALLDDRDLARYAEARGDSIQGLPTIESSQVPGRFGFVQDPRP
jgi:hypothetical protein